MVWTNQTFGTAGDNRNNGRLDSKELSILALQAHLILQLNVSSSKNYVTVYVTGKDCSNLRPDHCTQDTLEFQV